MAADDSPASAAAEAPPQKPPPERRRKEVFGEVLRRLLASAGGEAPPAFEAELWGHFCRLPMRYALDVNIERAEDVLTHMRLLEQARDPDTCPAFSVRVVQMSRFLDADGDGETNGVSSGYLARKLVHPPPSFGSSTNLESLTIDDSNENSDQAVGSVHHYSKPMHEITFSSNDKPKLLNQLTSLLAELGLDIQEAHVFSTTDGYSLDVFVVTGWHYEETQQLKEALEKKIREIEKQVSQTSVPWVPVVEDNKPRENLSSVHLEIPSDGKDVWEIDMKLLKFENKVASGSYGDLYRGTYCSQDVAIKVLKPERVNEDMQREFAQEVYIMRKVRHKNVVQFIGACTRPPSLCIVTEFMSGGSVYDYIHKKKGVFKLPDLVRVAIDVAKGMNYLHQNNIIHRDLKAANLLMDENKVVKVGDFGVARVKAQSGVMTAETGTYRWMAPEVIEHKPYDHKADVFSFAIVLWELLTNKIPYEYLTPLQAAVGVVQKNLRPTIPKDTHPKLSELLERCWDQDPAKRPDFSSILETLQVIAKEAAADPDNQRKSKGSGGLFSSLRKGH